MTQAFKRTIASAVQHFASPGAAVCAQSNAVQRQTVNIAFKSILKRNGHRVGMMMLYFKEGNFPCSSNFTRQTRSVKVGMKIAGNGFCRVCFQNVFKVKQCFFQCIAGSNVFGVTDVCGYEDFRTATECGSCFERSSRSGNACHVAVCFDGKRRVSASSSNES